MSKTDTNFIQTFETTMYTLFPDIKTKGVVSRQQIRSLQTHLKTERWPSWLTKVSVGRGLYAVPGSSVTSPIQGNTALAPTLSENVIVDYTNADSLIPRLDANYVPFGNYKDLEQIIVSKQFYPTYISGPTGNGKSTSIEQICAKHRRPLIRVNLNKMTDEDQLIGSKTLVDGNVEIVEGPVMVAMRMGIPLLLDEIDAGGANTLLCLQPILEGKPFYYKLKNEMVYPAAGFNMFATANTKGKGSEDGRYIGTNVLNEAFLERFAVTFNQEYPDAKVEIKIVQNLMKSHSCLDEDFASNLVKWAEAIRRTFDAGGVDETITTRRLAHIVRAFAIFKSQKKAIELCTNRFDDATRIAFVDLFDKVSTGEIQTEEAAAPVEPSQETSI